MLEVQLEKVVEVTLEGRDMLVDIINRLERLEKFQSTAVVKEWYTTEEAAKRLDRSEWTVRQWCNNGQVNGAKKVHGKGRTGEWRIPHDEVVRLQNDGPLPPGTFKPHGPAHRKGF